MPLMLEKSIRQFPPIVLVLLSPVQCGVSGIQNIRATLAVAGKSGDPK